MTQTITISPITRIEGHASIAIQLDDNGNVVGFQGPFSIHPGV